MALLIGCGKEPSHELRGQPSVNTGGAASGEPRTSDKRLPLTRVSNRPANKNGVVFIAEYHIVGNQKSYMARTAVQFRQDLERFYRMGFRPVLASEYLNDKMNLAPGASPVVFTFDDAQPSQFQLKEDGSLDANCALGIWQNFAKEHPDFPIKATFFVLPAMWGQPKLREKKVEMLKTWGCELANHTVTHPILRKLTDDKVKEEIAGGTKLLAKYGVTGDPLFALPWGSTPKNRDLLKGFNYQGKTYKLSAVFLVGANPAPAPTDPKFDRFRIPRMIAEDGDYGLYYWLDKVEKKEVKPYIAP